MASVQTEARPVLGAAVRRELKSRTRPGAGPGGGGGGSGVHCVSDAVSPHTGL